MATMMEIGKAITNGSTTGQLGWSARMLVLPPANFCTNPIAPASADLTNNSQKAVMRKPIIIEAIEAALVIRLKNNPPMNVGKKADAHKPKNIAVARAIIYPPRV